MTTGETLKIMAVLKVAYPNFGKDNPQETATFWAKKFSDYEYAIVSQAVDRYTDNSRYSPTVADIKALADGIKSKRENEYLEELTHKSYNLLTAKEVKQID